MNQFCLPDGLCSSTYVFMDYFLPAYHFFLFEPLLAIEAEPSRSKELDLPMEIAFSRLKPEPSIARWFLNGQVLDHEPIRQIEIHGDVFTVGRRAACSLCLPVSSVSSNHAEFEVMEGKLILRDLKSTNGTFVNGNKVTSDVTLADGDLIQFATIVFRLAQSNFRSENQTVQEDGSERALAMLQFDRLVNYGNVLPYFQPIVALDDLRVVGYEVLGRSSYFGLQMPSDMFHAASQLNLETELSEMFRHRGVMEGKELPADLNLFLNTHPKELGLPGLEKSIREIRKLEPSRMITLEIHEGAATDLELMTELCQLLKELDIKLAFDDFGVGRARLVELAEIRPDFLKFDMKLTKDIHTASANRQEMVALFVKMVNELGIEPLAEGIETEQTHNILKEMGFSFGQGYLYGKPQPLKRWLTKSNDTDDSLDITLQDTDSELGLPTH